MGLKIKDGYINLDKYNTFNPDIVHGYDDCTFEDNSVDPFVVTCIRTSWRKLLQYLII